MITARLSQDRGAVDFGWLKSWHSFSFGDYYDPKFMGFSTLRVINDDIIKNGAGFPPHSHRDMEIITFVTKGIIAHEDSTGSKGEITAGEIQVMTAGQGITHSEYAKGEVPCELFQIWITPERKGLAPKYRQYSWLKEFQNGSLSPKGGSLAGDLEDFILLASQDGKNHSISISADASMYFADIKAPKNITISTTRRYYLQVISGALQVSDQSLKDRDALMIFGEKELSLKGTGSFLLFDLP
ncbi:MAG: pirin family protein [Pseudomonadota bacterium]